MCAQMSDLVAESEPRTIGHGFKFTPVIGSILADLALEGRTEHSVEFLSATRPGLLRSD